MLLHPLVVPQLMARLQGQGVGKDAWWGSLLQRKLFARADDGGSATLGHLVALFVERGHALWKAADVQGWMRRAAEAAADAADGKATAAASAAAAAGAEGAAEGAAGAAPPLGADDWAAVARESFPAGAANDFRHLRVADFSDAVNALPREELAAAMEPPHAGAVGGAGGVGGDEMAEGMEEAMLAQLQHDAAMAAAGRGGAGGAQRLTEEQLRGANPLLMALRSLLPWVDAGEAPDYAADDNGGGGEGGGGGDAGGGGGAGQQQQQ